MRAMIPLSTTLRSSSRIPYDCEESFSCVLCTHKADKRQSVSSFIDILKGLYREAVAFPL